MALTSVSVVVTTRNRRALLAMTLRSVLRQQDVELEVIVVDEASSDDTAAMLATLDDTRVRVIHHEAPRGVSGARNHGAAEATGEWLAFVDDDDLWAPDKLARQLQAAESSGRNWAYAGSVNITDHGAIMSGWPPLSPDEVVAALPGYNVIPAGGSNVVMRRTAWAAAGPFDTRLRNTEDWEMWLRLLQQGPPACAASPLVAYRVHGSNASLDIAETIRGTRLIEALHHTRADWGRLHRWFAESHLRSGRRRAAIGQFARAALYGQASGVVSDLTGILRHRSARRLPGLRAERAPSRDPWIVIAAEWLRDFDGGTGAAGEGATTR